jgi:large subunit ribosomal protein L17
LLRNAVTSLLEHGKITTVETRAKEISSVAERMITLGKRGDLHARRQAASYLLSPAIVKRLFDTVSPKFQNRNGGYTRIIRTGFRKGDGAPLAIIELVDPSLQPHDQAK